MNNNNRPSYRIHHIVLLLAAGILSQNYGFVDSFRPTNCALRNSLSRATSATALHVNLPFFATSNIEKEGRASITDRLPVGKLFDSRDYIFNTASNVRGYEWTLKETEELLDDLLDACSGGMLFGNPPDGGKQDYELNQIVLIPMEWDQEALGLGGRYDVHDGQQRLVTLSLLFASMRERFQQFDGMEDTVTELADMLNPPKTRKDNVLRVELSARENDILASIQSGDGIEKLDKWTNATAAQLSKLSKPNQYILTNYNYLSNRMQALGQEELLELLDFIIEKVYLLVCVPESAGIARNIVMGQGKGKDHEVIDDFKGLVCFRYTPEEKDMYKTFDAWDAMSSSVMDLEAGVVGRKTISDACLMRSTTTLKQKIPTRKQLVALEQWLRHEIIETESVATGSEFFKTHIQPAALTLGQFRHGIFQQQPMFGFSQSGKITKMWPRLEVRLEFLREMIQGVTATKEVEMVVLDLGLRAKGGVGGTKPLSLNQLERYLNTAEQLALYFALVRPTAREKLEKLFGLLQAIETEVSSGKNPAGKLDILSEEENFAMYTAVSLNSLGSNAAGKRLCLALLKRLNLGVMLKGKYATSSSFSVPAAYLEPILPNKATKKAWGDVWPNKADRDIWALKLGNLCLVSNPAPTKEMKLPFADKKSRYASETWPLTAKLCERDVWDDIAIKESSATIVGLMKSIWG